MLIIRKIFNFYYEGFKNLKVGKTLWKIIIIKLFIILFIINFFIYDISLDNKFTNNEQKINYVYHNLTKE